MRPTVHDIAKSAGVSLATVDRVLNNRPGVREKTISKVNDAIRELGYVRDVYAANLARQRDYNFVFVLPQDDSAFLRSVHDAIREAADKVLVERINLTTIPVRDHDPHALVKVLDGLDPDETDGVAVMAPETPQCRDGIRRLKDKGLAVVTLITDLPNSERDHFVGINNLAAGRTAGVLLGRFVKRSDAKVLVLAGSMQARDHIERRLGFDQVIGESFPEFRVLPSIEGWNDGEIVRRLLPASLDANPDVNAIYSIGPSSRALADVLRERNQAHDIVVVAHELTPVSKDALQTGVFDAVIAQDVGHLVRSALRVLRARRDQHRVIASQEKIRIDIFLSENL